MRNKEILSERREVAEISPMDVKVLYDYKKIFIPTEKEESIQKIIDQYLGKNIYVSDNCYCECKELDPKDPEKQIKNILDITTGTFMTWEEFRREHKTYTCLKQHQYYFKSEIIDDILCIFTSHIKISDDEKSGKMEINDVSMIFRNKTLVRAYFGYRNEVSFSYENDGDYLETLLFKKQSIGFIIGDQKMLIEQMFSIWGMGIIGINYGDIGTANIRKFISQKELAPTKKQYELNNKVKKIDHVNIYRKKIIFDEVDGVHFMRMFKSYAPQAPVLEVFRLFFDNETVLLRNTNFYGFQREKVTTKDLNEWKVENIESVPECFKYSMKLVKEEDSIQKLISYIENPIIEQMLSLNMDDMVGFIMGKADEKHCKVDSVFEILYGPLGCKKNIRTFLGINKYQIECIQKIAGLEMSKTPVIRVIKYITEKKDISSMDNESFDTMFGFIKKHFGIMPCSLKKEDDFGDFIMLMSYLHMKYANVKNVISKCEKYIHLFGGSGVYVRRLIDTVVMSIELNCPIDDFGNTRDEAIDTMTRQHDFFSFAIEQKKLDERNKKNNINAYDKFQNKWNKLVYSSDDFIVIPPKKPMDLVEESLALHHCVRTFIEAVYDGKTSIFFIRRAESPNKPFFTVEIRNGEVRQIHGLQNCDVEDDKLRSFILEWIAEKKIKKGEWDKLKTV